MALGTVNVLWKRQMDGATLALLIVKGEVRDWLPHLATFFSEVRAGLILEFAEERGIDARVLIKAYREVSHQTGERNPDLEELLRWARSTTSEAGGVFRSEE